MCCCCWRLHRHQIHLISYGCVSFGLIATGLVFTVFAIFQKDSQIGKVWLAGPTTMVVGLVLCGKVIIDWGPAMLHAREDSIDRRLLEHHISGNAHIARMADPVLHDSFLKHQMAYHEPKCNGGAAMMYTRPNNSSTPSSSVNQEYPRPDSPCLLLSQYDSSLNNIDDYHGVRLKTDSSARLTSSNYTSRHQSSVASMSPSCPDNGVCKCSQYGSIRRERPSVFQGEEFVLDERNYFV
ncbi:hypothetical protein Q1695_001560 [Nippostrongylus brasiliensis]|nr:hypothetical protein Q1695_001560 [Nippostrongylus brasiliensis]